MYAHEFGASQATKHVLGVAVIIPAVDRQQTFGSYTASFPQESSKLFEARSISELTTRYFLGPTYALALGERVRVGVSPFLLYTRSSRSVEYSLQNSIASNSAFFTQRTLATREMSAWSFAPVIGAQVRSSEHLWFGVSLAPPSMHLSGNGRTIGCSSHPDAGSRCDHAAQRLIGITLFTSITSTR
jgi:hypothetical protein